MFVTLVCIYSVAVISRLSGCVGLVLACLGLSAEIMIYMPASARALTMLKYVVVVWSFPLIGHRL